MTPDPFEGLEAALQTGDLADELLERLSSPSGGALQRFRPMWEQLEPMRRSALLRELAEAAEEDLVLDFAPIFVLALDDPDPAVRELGFQYAAGEAKPDLLDAYLQAATSDPDEDVRLAALEGLSLFTFTAQTEDWPAPTQRSLEESLIDLLHRPGAESTTRRAALLALAYLTTPRVEAEIQRAYLQPDLREAAVLAMGRNCEEVWIPDLQRELETDDPRLRAAAAQAAAELEDLRLVPGLVQRLGDPSQDVRLAAVSALGTIGGLEAKAALTELLQSRDRALREAARDAIEELLANEDPLRLFRGDA